jgi:hypothetical protein
MKKIFLSAAAVIFVFCFTVVVMPGFAGATDMDHGMMMDNGKMMMDNGKMMMDKGQMMMDKGMKKDGEMMVKDGKRMMKHGQRMMKKAEMGEGKMMEKKDMIEKNDVKDMNK